MDGMTQTALGQHGPLAPPPRRRRWIPALLLVIVVAAIAAAFFLWPHPKPVTDESWRQTPLAVVAQPAAVADVPVWLDGLGTVQAFNSATVRSMIDGPLTAVRFREGQDVVAGDVLATIDARPYQAALDQAVAKKAQDEALLANARLDAARFQKLVAQNFTSGQTADTARAQVAQDEALVRADQAQIDTAKTNLSYTTIVAPFGGRTGVRGVDAGNIVHTADTTGIVTITQLRPISVVFTLPQQALAAVGQAMAAGAVEVLALRPGTGGGAVPDEQIIDHGTLAVLDNTVDATTGTIKLKATFPNDTLALWPGAFVDVRLRADTIRGAITVPPAAVQRGPKGAFAFTVVDGKAKQTPLTVGHEDATFSVITQGLAPGDMVVTDGGSRIADGRRVAVAAPDGLAPEAAKGPQAPGTKARH